MILRRALAAGLAVVLAAGAGSAALTLTAAPAAATTKPGYVAIVISGHGTRCVKWKSGIAGDAVLNDVAQVAYRSDGIILQIDGDPTSAKADDTHYWSYWHDTGKKWTYSNFGASSYQPAAGSVEGWAYDNGKSSAPPPTQQPSGLYAKLCGAKDKKANVGTVPVAKPTSTSATRPKKPNPTPTHRSAQHDSAQHDSARHDSARHDSAQHDSAPTRTSQPTSSKSSAPASSSSSAPVSRHRTGTASVALIPISVTGSAAAGSPHTSGSTSRAAPTTLDASPTAASSSAGSPLDLLVALGLIVVLGAGAGVIALSRRNTGH